MQLCVRLSLADEEGHLLYCRHTAWNSWHEHVYLETGSERKKQVKIRLRHEVTSKEKLLVSSSINTKMYAMVQSPPQFQVCNRAWWQGRLFVLTHSHLFATSLYRYCPASLRPIETSSNTCVLSFASCSSIPTATSWMLSSLVSVKQPIVPLIGW